MVVRWSVARRWWMPALLGGSVLAGPGCMFVRNGIKNLVYEPCLAIDEARLRHRHDRLAREAWLAMVGHYAEPDYCFSCDYKDGFQSGFADYLDNGGSGEPPSSPPRRYWQPSYATPAGLRAAEEWFVGFRHGSATAMASNLRELVTLPTINPPDFNFTQQLQPQNNAAAAGVSGSPGVPTGNTGAVPLPNPTPVPGSSATTTPPQSPPGVGGPIPQPNAPIPPGSQSRK